MRLKNEFVIIMFFSIIVGFFILNLSCKDTEISASERRKLAQFPKISISNLGNFSNDFENYAMDQFFLRDKFRAIKTYSEFFAFNKSDNNSLLIYKEGIVSIEKLNLSSIDNASKKMNEIYEKYLSEMNVYYSIIPDKSAYIENENKYPKYSFKDIEKIMNENVKNMEYITIFDDLTYESYYKTDSHWKQEEIYSVANKIMLNMNNNELKGKDNYIKKEINNFYGVYYGQLEYNLLPDNIYYLTNNIIDSSKVFITENKSTTPVYNLEKVNSLDKYDIFLSGAVAIEEIINPNYNDGEKELIIFRDSFGSSITPLFMEDYSKITLIDLRYVSSKVLEEYIEFKNQDVLFLYSTLILNNSFSLK